MKFSQKKLQNMLDKQILRVYNAVRKGKGVFKG